MKKREVIEIFEKHKIGTLLPDAIIFDHEEKDHKIVFYQTPQELSDYAIPDVERKKGKYYMKQTKDAWIPCYPILVDMYEYKNIRSGDKMPSDLWIGDKQTVKLQQTLALKKPGKWEWIEYVELIN